MNFIPYLFNKSRQLYAMIIKSSITSFIYLVSKILDFSLSNF